MKYTKDTSWPNRITLIGWKSAKIPPSFDILIDRPINKPTIRPIVRQAHREVKLPIKDLNMLENQSWSAIISLCADKATIITYPKTNNTEENYFAIEDAAYLWLKSYFAKFDRLSHCWRFIFSLKYWWWFLMHLVRKISAKWNIGHWILSLHLPTHFTFSNSNLPNARTSHVRPLLVGRLLGRLVYLS